jgi:hypothetical protein
MLVREAKDAGLTLNDLTVLVSDRDPFRLDTPRYHEIGYWVREHFNRFLSSTATIHWRGFHYVLVSAGGVIKPDGKPYQNTDADYEWLGQIAAKAARWLGYVDMDRLFDQRNDEPVIFRAPRISIRPSVETVGMLGVRYGEGGRGSDAEKPWDAYVVPSVFNFTPYQRYAFVLIGEKSSLAPVLRPLAQRYGADLYCGAGEISDIQLERMAREAKADGRMMVVFCFSDFDPAGWQMPVSIGRKLQAFETWKYPGLEFQVVPVSLLPEQVAAYDLPQTPLKTGEGRADRWRERFGREQTEIDLAALRPDDLTYWDANLGGRASRMKQAWQREAQAAVDAAIDNDELERINSEADEAVAAVNAARERLADLDQEIDDLVEDADIELPDPPGLPEAEVDEDAQKPLIDSRWGFVAGSQALKARKAYQVDEGDEDDEADDGE